MQHIKILFFGSTSDSVIVLEKLCHVSGVTCQAVVTQPAKPVGRKQTLTSTPVEIWATAHHIAALSFPHDPVHPQRFADDQTVIDTLQPFKADLLVSASFGQRIPFQAIQAAPFGGLNVHPSLLPRWRGADPVPWAIMTGDSQTGVTIVTLSEAFDQGNIITQKKIPITNKDFSDPLRTKLFELGAELLVKVLPDYLQKEEVRSYFTRRVKSNLHPFSYARRLTRDDGFEPWETIHKAFEDPEEARRIDRKFRALTPWPGIWTTIEFREKNLELSRKRLKILSCHLNSKPQTLNSILILDTVQLEGKKPVNFEQFSAAYLK